jgi:hypothetical protein
MESHYKQSLCKPRIDGFQLVSPQDELDERIYQEIFTEGCSILSFGSSPTAPEFTYSVGLYLHFLHPELLLMGLHPNTAHDFITKLRDEASQGSMLTSDSVRCDLFEDGRPVRFRTVPQERYLDYLGRNCNFYYSLFRKASGLPDFGFPVLQAIWPDRGGHFPDDLSCDTRFATIHTLTAQP